MTMPRVLLDATCVNDDAPTGASRYVQALVRGLIEAPEVEVHVFTFARRVFADLPAQVRVSRLDLPRVLGPVARETARRRFVARASREGVDLIHYTLDPAPPVRGVRSMLTLFDIARRTPSFRAATGGSLRAFMRTHLRYGLAKRMNLLLATTFHAAREISRDLPYPAERIRVSPIATDAQFVPGAPDTAVLGRYDLAAGDYILFVGQLGRQKNEEGLLSAFTRAKDRNLIPLTTQLVFAGDVSQAGERMRDASCNRADVRLTGVVNDAELVHLYRGAACLALPSFAEGYGLPVQEAMACGTPAVVSRETCLAEIAGDAGIAVDPHDIDEMSASLARLVNDAELRDRLSRRGVALAAERADKDMVRAHLEAYRDALG